MGQQHHLSAYIELTKTGLHLQSTGLLSED